MLGGGLLAVAGCSHAPAFPEATVDGVVRVDGQPAPKGAIRFSPAGAGQGAVAGATIEEGKYHCEHASVGKLVATFTLQAKEPRRFTDVTGAQREVPVSILPERYADGQPAQTHEGANQIDFDLSSEPAKGPAKAR